jgi:hypothetical protein
MDTTGSPRRRGIGAGITLGNLQDDTALRGGQPSASNNAQAVMNAADKLLMGQNTPVSTGTGQDLLAGPNLPAGQNFMTGQMGYQTLGNPPVPNFHDQRLFSERQSTNTTSFNSSMLSANVEGIMIGNLPHTLDDLLSRLFDQHDATAPVIDIADLQDMHEDVLRQLVGRVAWWFRKYCVDRANDEQQRLWVK